MMDNKGRGRPLGFRLSEESKRAISESKKGQKHSESTKDKISRTLVSYFRSIHPLSSELYEQYKEEIESSDEIKRWFDSVSLNYDETKNIYSERSLNSKRYREISIEYNINMDDNPYTNANINNPETLCEIKELCRRLGLNFSHACRLLAIED